MQGLIGGFANGDPSAIQRRSAGDPMAPLLALSPDIVLEPSALDTLVSGRLSSAHDHSGNGRVGAQATAGNRPLLVAGAGPGGTDAWRFAPGRPDFLEIANDPGLEGLAWTWFLVIHQTIASQSVFSKAVANLPRPTDAYTDGTGRVMQYADITAATATHGAWHAVGVRRSTSANASALYIDGSVDATAFCGATINAGTPPIRIGLRADGYGPMDGDLAHVCAWNRALTDPEIATVHAYFAARFGL